MATKPAIPKRTPRPPADLQNLLLLRIYIWYRSLLSILLLLGAFNVDTRLLLGTRDPQLYVYAASVFLATNLVLLALLKTRIISRQASLFVVFFVDILAITVLSDASGGMSSGLPILLVVSAATSAILINSSTIATLIAALCVISLLADTIRLINEQFLPINRLLPAGLLGALIFAVSLLIQAVAKRLGAAEALARKRASDLSNLQHLNEQIVQQLQTGILIVYGDSSVRVMNQAATRLLDPERSTPLEQGRQLVAYNHTLAGQFQRWSESGSHQPTPIEIGGDAPPVIVNFRALENTPSGDALVFIEDYTPVTQQAQSLKLASLGRLTASIAHEIRNPLGAISHAAQLLQESEALAVEDNRLAEIIQAHAQRMNAIIESVMQISRRQAPRLQQLALRGWLQTFLQDYRSALTQPSDIELLLPESPVEILFDPEHLQRVLGNLLDNALRHSRINTGKATATLAISWEHLSQRCLFDVIDDGLGVALSEQAKLFEPFYTTAEKGTGLGLYLCKELCEINNANLIYRPTLDGKSCFRIAVVYRG